MASQADRWQSELRATISNLGDSELHTWTLALEAIQRVVQDISSDAPIYQTFSELVRDETHARETKLPGEPPWNIYALTQEQRRAIARVQNAQFDAALRALGE
jgi:hypothetical protein